MIKKNTLLISWRCTEYAETLSTFMNKEKRSLGRCHVHVYGVEVWLWRSYFASKACQGHQEATEQLILERDTFCNLPMGFESQGITSSPKKSSKNNASFINALSSLKHLPGCKSSLSDLINRLLREKGSACTCLRLVSPTSLTKDI